MTSLENSAEFAKPPSNPNRPPRPSSIKTNPIASSTTRESLRKEMRKLRRSLTPREQTFLENLCNEGEDVEIELARARLNDASLFDHHEGAHDDEKVDWQEGDDFDLITSIDRGASGEQIDAKSPTTSFRNSTSSIGSSRASCKGQMYLLGRKNSVLREKLWKAHEHGLSVASPGSRKPMRRSTTSSTDHRMNREEMIRNNSLLSTATQDLLLQGGPTQREGEDEIFRTIDRRSKMERSSSFSLGSPSLPKSIMRPPDIPPPSGPMSSRMLSDSSRRSVSFKEELNSDSSTRNVVSPRYAKSMMSHGISEEDSESAFGSTSTLESFPALKHAEMVRSDSAISAPSIHRGQPVRSESDVSIPVIGKARAMRSDSVSSALTSDETTQPIWSSPLASPVEGRAVFQRNPNAALAPKPVLLRKASRNAYQGEGIEVSDMDGGDENVNKVRLYASMLSMGENSERTGSSWDDEADRKKIFRDLRSSFTDDELAGFFLGRAAKDILAESMTSVQDHTEGSEPSWDMNSDTEDHVTDAWDVLKDEYAIGYGANGSLPFRILGTSADDEDATPHVLSPPLMESLQQFFPFAISEDNFWMKYSLLRDGASLHSLLQHIRGTKYTILAVETADGEVLGSFTSEAWRKNWNYFGTGESFLWRMRKPRTTQCHSLIEQAQLESELDVYPWTGENNCVQLCTHDTLAVGGGVVSSEGKEEKDPIEKVDYGFGLAIDRELMNATSSHCATFGSPPLSQSHPNGEPFEIVNLEVWTLTPCATLDEAEKLELGMLFLQSHRQ